MHNYIRIFFQVIQHPSRLNTEAIMQIDREDRESIALTGIFQGDLQIRKFKTAYDSGQTTLYNFILVTERFISSNHNKIYRKHGKITQIDKIHKLLLRQD